MYLMQIESLCYSVRAFMCCKLKFNMLTLTMVICMLNHNCIFTKIYFSLSFTFLASPSPYIHYLQTCMFCDTPISQHFFLFLWCWFCSLVAIVWTNNNNNNNNPPTQKNAFNSFLGGGETSLLLFVLQEKFLIFLLYYKIFFFC